MGVESRQRPSERARRLPLLVALGALAIAGCDSLLGEEETDGPRIERYAYTVHLEAHGARRTIVLDQSGVVEGPDKEHARLRLRMGRFGMDSETIRIENARWVRGHLPFIDVGFSPTHHLKETDGTAARRALRDALDGLTGAPDTVNGTLALRYELSGPRLLRAARSVVLVPAGATAPEATLWVATETGAPVKLVLEASGRGGTDRYALEINVTGLNDPSHRVTAPTKARRALPASAYGLAKTTAPQEDAWDYVKGVLGAAIGVLTGVDPFSVDDAVDIVEENAESLAESRKNAEEYFDAYPDPDEPDRDRYTLADEDLSDKTWLYKWFWSWFE